MSVGSVSCFELYEIHWQFLPHHQIVVLPGEKPLHLLIPGQPESQSCREDDPLIPRCSRVLSRGCFSSFWRQFFIFCSRLNILLSFMANGRRETAVFHLTFAVCRFTFHSNASCGFDPHSAFSTSCTLIHCFFSLAKASSPFSVRL